MTLNEIMANRHLSKYRLAKNSNIPYTTLSDILSGKTQLGKCNADTVRRLSKELKISMEDLLSLYDEKRCNFELYKSNVCHRLKEVGDINFIIETLESKTIREYFNKKWYLESFYLLAMLDYISRINKIPLCKDYEDIRKLTLQKTVYPASIIAMSVISNSDDIKQKVKQKAIPEFMHFNIVESEIRDVI